MSAKPWLGKDEHGGVRSQRIPDRDPPKHWRLDAIYATGRPHHPAASPDGAEIAYILSSGDESDVWVVAASGDRPRRLSTDRELTSYWEDSAPQWSPAGSKIAYTSGSHTMVTDRDGGVPRRIADATLGTWLDDETLVVVVERKRITRLAIAAIDDPWPRPFGPTGGDVGSVRSLGDGRVVAVFWPKSDLSRSDIIAAEPDGEWTTLVGLEDRRALSPVAFGKELAFVLEEDEWRTIQLMDLDSGDRSLLAADDADFDDLAWSPDGSRLAAVRLSRGRGDLVVIDRDGAVETMERGGFWQTPTWVGDGIVAIHEAHDTPPRLVKVSDGTLRTLHDEVPLAISASPHSEFERVVIPSHDGMEIEGFLYKPGDTSKPVPAVVYPHGGPTSVYGEEWDGHAQYFVDKGYAWLAINFRGSTTYGLTFERANHDDWGIGDTADCIAAGKYLQGLDWVDSRRLAIFGASYGSYMALASLVHPENPFACGVAKYGDCDILTSWAQGDRGGREDLERMMGHPSSNRDGYRTGSPIHSVEQIDKPILVAHGERDARVHVEQAEQLVAELKRLGKQYEYVTYPEEAHGFLRRASQIDFYQRLERFLDWYLL